MPATPRSHTKFPYATHPLWRALLIVFPFIVYAEVSYGGGIDALYPEDPLSVYNLAQDSRTRYLSVPCGQGLPEKPIGLSEIVDQALCHNPQTREAWMTTRLRAAELGISKGAYLPSITVTADITHAISENTEIDIGQTVPLRYTQRSMGVNVNYVLLDFGARQADIDSAKEILTAANATLNETIQSVYLSAAQAYYDLFADRAEVSSAKQAEYYASEAVKAAYARHDAGLAALNDVLQAKTQYSQATLARQKAEAKARVQEGVLATVMGLSVDTPIKLSTPDVSYKPQSQESVSPEKADTVNGTRAITPADELESAVTLSDMHHSKTDNKQELEEMVPGAVTDPGHLHLSYGVTTVSHPAMDHDLVSSGGSPSLAFVEDLGPHSSKFFLSPDGPMQDTAFIPKKRHSMPLTASATTGEAADTMDGSELSESNEKGVIATRPNTSSSQGNSELSGADTPQKVKSVVMTPDISQLLAIAQSARPQLQAAHAQVRSAEAKLKAANAAGLPSLVLTMGASTLRRRLTQPTVDPLTGQSSDVTSVLGGAEKTIGFNIQFPIFDRFNRQYNRQIAENQLKIAQIQEERLTNQVKVEVWQAYQDNLLQLQAIQSTQDLLDASRFNYKVAEGRYKVGVGSMLELMNALSQLNDAEQQHIQALYSWQMARLKLAQSIGKLGLDKI